MAKACTKLEAIKKGVVSVAQLSLFSDEPVIEKKPVKLEWSYSRRESLERCPRQYYYSYYGGAKRLALKEAKKEEIRFLKSLSNRFLRAGEILHLIASSHLRKLGRGESSDPSSLIRWGRSLFQEDLLYSRDPEGNSQLAKKRFPPAHLLEFYYSQPNADEQVAEVEQRMTVALERFFHEDPLQQFHEGASQSGAQVECDVRFTDGDHRFRGKIDLSYPAGEKRTTVDWKMGSSHASEDSLQLFFYGIAAMHEFGVRPEQLELWRVYLGSMTLEPQEFTDTQYRRTRARMMQDLQNMALVDPYGREGVSEAFTPNPSPKVCCSCPFQAVCPME